MTPFTRFFGRLTEQLGAAKAAALVDEFAGQTITFQGYDVYGFPVDAPTIGQDLAADLVEAGTRANGKKTMTRLEAAERLKRRFARANSPVERVVSPYLSVGIGGIEYDVSHITGVSVGQRLSVTQADLRPMTQPCFHPSAADPLQGIGPCAETNPAPSDRPAESNDRKRPETLPCAAACRLRPCVTALEDAAHLITRMFQELQPLRGTQSTTPLGARPFFDRSCSCSCGES